MTLQTEFPFTLPRGYLDTEGNLHRDGVMRLATAYDEPAMGGVYKLTALRDQPGDWQYKLKLSEQAIKISNPGVQQVRRFIQQDRYRMDVLYDEEVGINGRAINRGEEVSDPSLQPTSHEDLLVPVFRGGKLVYETPLLSVSP